MKYLYSFLLFLYFVVNFIPLFSFRLTSVIAGLLFIVSLLVAAGKKDKFCSKAYIVWLFIWMAFAISSCMWAVSLQHSLWVLKILLPVLATCISIQLFVKGKQDLFVVVKSFYIAALVELVYLFLFVNVSEIGNGTRISDAIAGDNEEWNGNIIALQMVVSIYIGYFIFWKNENNRIVNKITFFTISLAMVFLIGISGSRSSSMGLLIPIFVISLAKNKHIIRSVVGISVVLAVSYYLIMNVPIFYETLGMRLEELLGIMEEGESAEGDTSRLVLILMGIDWFLTAPFLGYGINNFRALSDRLSVYAGENFYAHNNYIELLVDVGLIGTLIYYTAFILYFRNYKCIDVRTRPLIIAIFVFMLFVDIANVSYYSPTLQFVLCVSFCIISLEKNIIK